MLRIPSYFAELARDSLLVGRDPQVWVIALGTLDFYEYRELLLETVAGQFAPAISKASVHRSLQRLVERGYLERSGDNGAHGTARYRIPLARIFPRSRGDSVLHV